MPLPNQPWSTNLPASQDTVGVEQPDLTDDSSPGADDGHRVLASHQHAIRDKVQYLATEVGDSGELPGGCLKARATALEAAPPSHAASHQAGGGDAIKLDDLAAPDDNTDLDVSISAHGLAPKLSNVATEYLDGTGSYSVPAGGVDTEYSAQTAAVTGTETFTVTAMETNANIPGGFDLRYCVVNGIVRKIVTSAPGTRECRATAATTIEVGNLNIGDDVEFLFGRA